MCKYYPKYSGKTRKSTDEVATFVNFFVERNPLFQLPFPIYGIPIIRCLFIL